MCKILLVDDEILVRVGIKSIMNWENEGHTIIGEAADGEEALEKIRSNPPDIVLTDLMMKPMNGFELIKVLKKEYPSIKIIVLSCYNDFDNVKEAMKLGANDYVFKLTLKTEELLKTLNAVAGEIDARPAQTVRAGASKNDRIVLQNMGAIKKRLLKKGIEKSYISVEEFVAEMKDIGIKVDFEKPYAILYVSVDDFFIYDINSKIKEKELLKFSMQNIMEEVLQRFEKAEVFDYENGDTVIAANLLQQPESFLAELYESFEQLKEYIKRYIGVSVTAGLSGIHAGGGSLPGAVAEAVAALSLRFYHGGGGFYRCQDVHCENGAKKAATALQGADMALLGDFVDHLDNSRLHAFIAGYFDFIAEGGRIEEKKVRGMLLELLYPFTVHAKKRGIDMEELKDENGFTPYHILTHYETFPAIRQWFEKFADQFIALCKKKTEERVRTEIVKAKEYVRANIGRDISVADAATHINMSESYFSHLFKKETGISFIDYVNNVKIEKAKELLLQTDMKVYEIASATGFDNANYFSMLFKRITGVSPNDYRK